jgi:hypothetical protein
LTSRWKPRLCWSFVRVAEILPWRGIDRPHLFVKLLAYHRRKGEPKGFTWQDYRDLIIVTHRQLAAPLVWCWDNPSIHLAPELASFAEQNQAWLRIYRLPAYAPDLNPAEGIWSLLKRSIANFAAAGLDSLVRIVKRKLKKNPVPAPPDRRLPGRHRPDNRALVTTCTTSSTWLRLRDLWA